jgi:hypothetical protein
MNKSQIFSIYNKARKAPREGKLDEGAVNRALGVIQRKGESKYITTIRSCNCDARKYNSSKPCKHMIAKMMQTRITGDQPTATQTIYVELEYEGYAPADLKMNFHKVSYPKMSIGKGLINVSVEDLIEALTGYEAIKTEYVKKNSWGTINYKMWWMKKG